MNEYLIPSMVKQGIPKYSITVFNDEEGLGCLHACMKCFSELPEEGSTWHLQDDIIISHDFAQVTNIPYDEDIIACGVASDLYDRDEPPGLVTCNHMWFSFQCILIPNAWAKDCAKWCDEYIIGNPIYKMYWETGLNDDWVFRHFIRTFHTKCSIINISPNIVDHVDWLIGGSVASDFVRTQRFRSKYWTDNYLIDELKQELQR